MEHRAASEVERADALRTSVTDLRKREQAIATLSSLRNHQSLTAGAPDDGVLDTVQVASDEDVEERATRHDRNAQLTRAIMAAVNDPGSSARRAQNPLALAAVYLSFWEDLSRPQVARELDVLPKTASAAMNRVMKHIEQSDLM